MSEHAASIETKQSSLTGPTTGMHPHWELERLEVVRYDDGGFEGFLARIGTEEEELLGGLRDGGERREWALSCYQEWLVFGVLHEWRDVCPGVFEIEGIVGRADEGGGENILLRDLVNLLRRFCAMHVQHGMPEDTINDHDDGTEVFTNVWPSIIKSFENGNSRRIFREKENHLTSITTQAFSATYRLHRLIAAHWKKDVNSPLQFYPQMLVSLEILLETIRVVQNLLSGNTAAPTSRAELPMNAMYIRWRMRKDEWCPSRIESVLSQSRGSGSVNYLLSLMPSFDSRDHGGCSIIACSFVAPVPLVGDTDKLGSATELNQLHLYNKQTVESILAEHSFPVITSKTYSWTERLTRRDRNDWPFDLVKYQPELRYVAISHVWSHGLGNPESTSAMNSLLEYTTNLKHSTFWIDTICVPPSGSPFKLKGIAKLREVYSKASIVLIVDGRLSQLTITSLLEAKLQFLCCEWFSRLWTLQEGWLASDLRVQFQNTAVSVDQLLRTFGLASIYPGRMGLDKELHEQLRPYFDKTAGAVNLMSLQRAMHGRRVTVPTDEAICVATLLGLDFAAFEPGPPTMEKILRLVKLPDGLLWAEGPRLTTPRFRWAPSSLLHRYGNPRLLNYQEDPKVLHTSSLTPGGLRTQQAYFELDKPLDLGSIDDDITSAGSAPEQAIRLVVCGNIGNEIAVFRGSGAGGRQLRGTAARCLKRPCVIVGSLRKADGMNVMLGQAILVEGKEIVAGVRQASYAMGLREMNAELVERYVHDRIVRVGGKFVDRAEWCID